MIYATDDRRDMLVEFRSQKALEADNSTDKAEGGNGKRYRPVTREYAHKWVRDGYVHETGLYVDGKRVRYAPADPEGY